MDAMFKERYGSLQDVLVRQFKCYNMWGFRESEQLGDVFKESVLLQNEHGVTYAAPTEDAFTLNAPIAGATKTASVQGSQHVIRSRIGFNAVASSKNNKAAFGSVFDVVVGNTKDSLNKRIEIDLLYGQSSLGTIAAINSDTITITTAQWAPGIWAGAEGAVIAIFENTAGAPGATVREGGTEDHTITAVDIDNRTITVGTIATDAVVGDHIVWPGTWDGTAWKTQVGIHTILGAPTTLFGITTASFSLWRPAQYACGSAQFSFQKLVKATYRAQSRGYEGDMIAMVNPTTWSDLLIDEAAVRRHNGFAGGQVSVGADGITFHSQVGTITIKSSIYVKEGFAYLYPKTGSTGYRRIGATDITTKPFGEGETFLREVTDVAAYEFLLYDNQALYSGRPAYGVRVQDIVNGT